MLRRFSATVRLREIGMEMRASPFRKGGMVWRRRDPDVGTMTAQRIVKEIESWGTLRERRVRWGL